MHVPVGTLLVPLAVTYLPGIPVPHAGSGIASTAGGKKNRYQVPIVGAEQPSKAASGESTVEAGDTAIWAVGLHRARRHCRSHW